MFFDSLEEEVQNYKDEFLGDLDGKQNILLYKEYFDNEFIACVDSDYDYILKKSYLNNSYIFHTYVYAVENYQVCAKTLNRLVNDINICCNIDFYSLFTNMTPIIKDALLYDIYLKGSNQNCIREIFKFNNISYDNLNEEYILNHIKDKIDNIEINEKVLLPYKNIINEDLNINQDFLHLYIEGHIVFDSIFNILEKLQYNDIEEKKQIIKEVNEGIDIKYKINELNNKKLDIKTALKLNYKECFYNNFCPSMKQIISDIQNSLGDN